MQGIVRAVIPVAALVAVGLGTWSQLSMRRANSYVDEANTAIDSFNVDYAEAGKKFKELFTDAHEQAFPGNRAELEPAAKELVDLYARTIDHARTASTKFDEAAKQPIGPWNVRYNQALGAQFAKMAERCEVLRDYTRTLLDPQIDTPAKLQKKQAEYDERLTPIMADEKKSEDEAKKILAEHADQFE